MSYQKEKFTEYMYNKGNMQPGGYCNGLDNIEKYFEADIDTEYEKDQCEALYARIQLMRTHPEQIGKNEHTVRQYASNLKRYREFRQNQESPDELIPDKQSKAIKELISEYKNNFDKINSEEIYKWKAIGFYKKNWDINAENFGEMVELSFSKYGNLLSGGRYYAYATLVEFAKAEPEKVRNAFKTLYNESKEISVRFDEFRKIFADYFTPLNKSHYQDLHAISIYLSSEYPERYYFYKYGIVKNYIGLFNLNIDINRVAHETDKLKINNKLCDEICDVVNEDSELINMLYSKLDDSCYRDSDGCLLAFDIMYFTRNRQEPESNINLKTLETPITLYINGFSDRFKNDKSKWEAVKIFNAYWDIEANDFAHMFNQATKSSSFISLSSGIPKRSFCKIAEKNPVAVKNLFSLLFDENINLEDRCNEFYESLSLLTTEKDVALQDRSISPYLFLRYPEKYYIYRPNEFLSIKRFLQGRYAHISGDKVKKMLEAYEMYDSIKSQFEQRNDFIEEYNTVLCSEGFSDNNLGVLVSDFASFMRETNGFSDADNTENLTLIGDEWWPSLDEFNPNITKENWIKYLSEIEIPDHPAPMQMLKAMWELGGAASCKRISNEYGGSPYRYVGCTMNLGRRVKKYFNLSACMDENQERYFPFPFLGKKGTDGEYIYKLRPELFAALDEIDLSKISATYENSTDEDTDIAEPYTKVDFLKDVYISEEKYETCVSRLKHKKNIILQGAPGVGKTFAARRLAWSMMSVKDNNRIEFVQFHQSYSYEDFIMGYKPDGNGFKLEKGIFYEFCNKAKDDPYNDYFFIIDEINRGNMSKIFGELLMLIENDYRKMEITLAYNKKPFSVPENLYIIGMMNTADRSLAMIDYALRRRFSFVEMTPGFESEGFESYQSTINNHTFGKLIGRIKALNADIENDASLGKGFCVGHSYFCNLNADCSDTVLKEIVEYDIVPMLEEYWFDDEAKAKSWSNDLRGVFNG